MGTATMGRSKKEESGAAPDDKTEKKGGRTTAPVQVDMELARMAAVIAAHDGKKISDLISPLIRQWLRTNYERVQREIAVRVKEMREEDSQG